MSRKLKYILCLLVLSTGLYDGFGQTIRQLNGTISISGVTILDDTNYTVKGTFTDASNVYSSLDVNVGDRIVDGADNTFEIMSITSNSNPITATVKSFNKGEIPSFGMGTLFRPTNTGLPLVSNSSPAGILVSTINTTILTLDAILPTQQKGSSLPISAASAGDILLLTADSRLYKLSGSGWTKISDSDIADQYVFNPADVPIQSRGTVIRMVFDGNKYYVSDGTQWLSPTTASSLPTISKYGDIFFVTGESKLYMYDANDKWVSLGGSRPGTSLPSPGDSKPGETFYNTADNTLYLFNGSQWIPLGNALEEGKVYLGNASGIAEATDISAIKLNQLGAAVAPVSAGNQTITDLADPVAAQDAATKNYVDTKVVDAGSISLTTGSILVGNADNKAEAVAKNSISLSDLAAPTAALAMGGNAVTGLADPAAAQDAATKKYVDDRLDEGISLADANILIGNTAGKASAVVVSGDILFDNTGLATIQPESIDASKMKDGIVSVAKLTTAGIADADKVYVTDSAGIPTLIARSDFSSGGSGTDTFADDFVVNGVPNYLKWTNGQTVPAKGKTAVELLLEGSQMAVAPAYSAPTTTLTSSPAAGNVELGKNLGTITLSSVFSQNDAGPLGTTVYSKNDVPIAGNTDVISNFTGAVKYTVTHTYQEGAVKNNNLGNQDPGGRIAAGSITRSITFSPVSSRYYGFVSSVTPGEAEVRTLTKDQTATKTLKTILANPSTAKYLCFRYPVAAGAVTSIKINGFAAFGAFTISQSSFTNENGYTSNYYLIVGNNPFDNSGASSTDIDIN